jgi:hypothetical protein
MGEYGAGTMSEVHAFYAPSYRTNRFPPTDAGAMCSGAFAAHEYTPIRPLEGLASARLSSLAVTTRFSLLSFSNSRCRLPLLTANARSMKRRTATEGLVKDRGRYSIVEAREQLGGISRDATLSPRRAFLKKSCSAIECAREGLVAREFLGFPL